MASHRFSAVLCGTAATLFAAVAIAGEITLFDQENFNGRREVLRTDAPNFDRGNFNDRAQSVIVRDGVWQVCSDAYFRGQCVELQPGEYPVLEGGLARSISSARQVADTGRDSGRQQYGASERRDYGNYAQREYAPQGREPRATLYEGRDFHGRAFDIDRPAVNNLDRTNFNDRAESLRVDEGRWMFCSDANFQGTCRTFGPGEYPTLPPELDHRISSGRVVENR